MAIPFRSNRMKRVAFAMVHIELPLCISFSRIALLLFSALLLFQQCHRLFLISPVRRMKIATFLWLDLTPWAMILFAAYNKTLLWIVDNISSQDREDFPD